MLFSLTILMAYFNLKIKRFERLGAFWLIPAHMNQLCINQCPSLHFKTHLYETFKDCLVKVGLKLNIQYTKIMAFGPITSW